MKKIYQLFVLPFLGLIFACGSPQNGKNEENAESIEKNTLELDLHDPHSFSKPMDAVVKHLNWKAEVDFEQQMIRANATYTIDNVRNVDSIYLDIRNLKIKEISDGEKKLAYSENFKDEVLGSELAIEIHENTGKISIEYETTEGSDALQFLSPIQTADKKSPFLFTQSQAILARTWIPCQDSPGIRFTYQAEVKVPQGMLALMSAKNPVELNPEGIYHFTMERPIPSYLLALAVGDIQYQKLGEITGVYAESSVIEAAAYELEEVQNMVDAAERLYGDYRWGKYDVIFLPPSFPFGGMENPRLTFATPTIIAGDRSLTGLVAHELAHSWSGNLVTNASWESIWLNEGFTVYIEQRLMEEIYGEDYEKMLTILKYQDLLKEIEGLKKDDRMPDTRLAVNLQGRDPDVGLTRVPYNKGLFLLKLIEETVGRAEWDKFMKTYFEEFAFKVMTSDGFVTYINRELLDKNPDWKEAIRLEEWVYEEGLPDNCPKVKSDRFVKVEKQFATWIDGGKTEDIQTDEWATAEWMHFLRLLPNDMTENQMQDLDKVFGFTTIGNAEIKCAWFEKVIPNNYAPADQATEDFLVIVGLRKFLEPIYQAVLQSDN